MQRLRGGDTSDAAVKKFSLFGSTTDSGDGGTGKSFKDELLTKENLTCSKEEFLVGFCAKHILQISFCNSTKALMGEGGLDRRNFLQLCHSLYDFEEKFERGEFLEYVTQARETLSITTDMKWKKSKPPS